MAAPPPYCGETLSRTVGPACWTTGLSGKGDYPGAPCPARRDSKESYFRCLLTSLVISNIETCFLPPNTGLSFSSALIMRLFLLSCSL